VREARGGEAAPVARPARGVGVEREVSEMRRRLKPPAAGGHDVEVARAVGRREEEGESPAVGRPHRRRDVLGGARRQNPQRRPDSNDVLPGQPDHLRAVEVGKGEAASVRRPHDLARPAETRVAFREVHAGRCDRRDRPALERHELDGARPEPATVVVHERDEPSVGRPRRPVVVRVRTAVLRQPSDRATRQIDRAELGVEPAVLPARMTERGGEGEALPVRRPRQLRGGVADVGISSLRNASKSGSVGADHVDVPAAVHVPTAADESEPLSVRRPDRIVALSNDVVVRAVLGGDAPRGAKTGRPSPGPASQRSPRPSAPTVSSVGGSLTG
jgi:hypothetical protein